MQTIAQCQIASFSCNTGKMKTVSTQKRLIKKKFISMLRDLNRVCIIFEMGKNGYVPNFLPV